MIPYDVFQFLFSYLQDPREEVMTLERVLLQTIKFDLQVDMYYQCPGSVFFCFQKIRAKNSIEVLHLGIYFVQIAIGLIGGIKT